MVAQVMGLTAKDLVYTISDAHIYKNQIKEVKELVKRKPMKLPTVKINPKVKDIFKFKFEDFTLENYNSHPFMKIPVSL